VTSFPPTLCPGIGPDRSARRRGLTAADRHSVPPPWWCTSDKEVYDVVSTYPLVTRSPTGADYRIVASGYRLTHWWTFAQRTGSARVLWDRPRCVRSGLHTAGLHPVKGRSCQGELRQSPCTRVPARRESSRLIVIPGGPCQGE
jgi:hypothetical protein